MAETAEKIDPVKARTDLLNKFDQATTDLADNKKYYESERRPTAIGIATPPKMQSLLANVGIPRLYVDAIAARLTLEGFRLPGSDDADETLWDWWQANQLDTESSLGHVEALVHGRAFITVAAPSPLDLGADEKTPIIRVESASALYAEIDPRTRKVAGAVRKILDPQTQELRYVTLYLPDQTIVSELVQGDWVDLETINHGLQLVPVIPLANRLNLQDLTGTTEITPEIRSVTDAASRLLMNMQATAELMAIPQRLLFGINPEELGVDPTDRTAVMDTYMAKILAFTDSDGKAQQFAAAELRNFVDGIGELMRQASSYTGLPASYFAQSTDNPASADALKASESRFVRQVERKAIIFGGAWEQAMRTAQLVMNPGEIPPEYYRMESIWRDPSTPTYAAKADAAAKLYANGLGVIPRERARVDMGYSVVERQQMRKWDEEQDPALQLAGQLGVSTPKATPAGPSGSPSEPKTGVSEG